MDLQVIKVELETFEQFLDAHDNPQWQVYDETSGGNCMDMPLTTAARIIEKIGWCYNTMDDPYIYIMMPNSDDIEATSLEEIPLVKDYKKIYEFIRPSGGKDYLYFTCSQIDVSNEYYLTLLRVLED